MLGLANSDALRATTQIFGVYVSDPSVAIIDSDWLYIRSRLLAIARIFLGIKRSKHLKLRGKSRANPRLTSRYWILDTGKAIFRVLTLKALGLSLNHRDR